MTWPKRRAQRLLFAEIVAGANFHIVVIPRYAPVFTDMRREHRVHNWLQSIKSFRVLALGATPDADDMCKKKNITYNSGDWLVVTHPTTIPLVHCLYMAEQTGSLAFSLSVTTRIVNLPLYGSLLTGFY